MVTRVAALLREDLHERAAARRAAIEDIADDLAPSRRHDRDVAAVVERLVDDVGERCSPSPISGLQPSRRALDIYGRPAVRPARGAASSGLPRVAATVSRSPRQDAKVKSTAVVS